MSYIFMDESGDLGFDFSKKQTSKYFVITFLFVHEKGPIEKIVKKIFSGFNKKQVKMHNGVLHCFKEHPRTRKKLLTSLACKKVAIITIYLEKNKVYTRLQDEKHVLYNYVTNILLDRIYTKKLLPAKEQIVLVASKRETNKFINDNFRQYLQDQVKKNHKQSISIEIKTIHQEKCLQVVDFACWAIFRKIEGGDISYYNLIRKCIIEENPLFR